MSKKAITTRSLPALRITRRKLYVAMLAASQLMGAGEVMAAPEGGVVVGGAGTIDQAGLNTTIRQATERMAIDWQSFDVKSNERVQFIQPKSTSVALNRVLSNKGSEILGRIDANGQVFLINPNGIVFGRDSQINVGGMLASGLSIDPNKFMNGEFALTALEGTEGAVINSGIINAATGGSVTLVGQQVKNEGLISAKLGAVSLAAGKEAVVTFDRTGMLGVKVTKAVLQDELGVDAAVINSGDINAEGGQILMTASVSQDIFSDAVNHDGMSKETSVVVHEDGSFTLGGGADVVNTGNINASTEAGDAGHVVVLGNNITSTGNIHANAVVGTAGSIELHSTDITTLKQNAKVMATTSQGSGGDVKILGNKVGLFDTAEVNASGANGGGQVLVGGDKTGGNHKIRNADFIYLDENTSVKADGLLNGDGGKLITFASNTARIYGSLSARGGDEGGNGGFIETSGLWGLELLQTPDVSAAKGYAGSWLIDPLNVAISNGQNRMDLDASNTFTATSGKTVLNFTTLANALRNGTKVTVSTGSDTATPEQKGTITVGALDIDRDLVYSNGSLILDAASDIIINTNIRRESGNGSLDLTLKSGGNISLASGKTIETKGGNFTATSIDFTSTNGTINTSNMDEVNNTVYAGDIKITALGNVNLGAMSFAHNQNDNINPTIKNLGSIDVSGKNITLNKELNFNNTGRRKGNGTLLNYTDGNNNEDAFLHLNATENITVAAGAGIYDQYGDGRDTLDIKFTAGGIIEILAAIYTGGGNFEAVGGSFISKGITIDTENAHDGKKKGDNGQDTQRQADWSNGGNITIKAATSIDVGALTTDRNASKGGNIKGNLVIAGRDSSNAVVVKQSIGEIINVAGTTNFAAGTGAVSFSNQDNDFTGEISADSAGSLVLADNNNIDLGNITLVASDKTSFTTATGSITQSVDSKIINHAGGTIELNAGLALNNVNINTVGEDHVDANGGKGGDVNLTAMSIFIKGINTSGGKASITEQPMGTPLPFVVGGAAGAITVTAKSNEDVLIQIDGDLLATSGTPKANPSILQAPITLNLNGSKAGEVRFNTAVSSDITVKKLSGETASLKGFAADTTWAMLDLHTGTMTNTGKGIVTFVDLDELVGNNLFMNTLKGASLDTTWRIAGTGDASNSNTVTLETTADKVKYGSFKNMWNLQGGTASDNFIMLAGGKLGLVDGGGDTGKNTLTGRDTKTTWDVGAGGVTLTATDSGDKYVNSIANIHTLQGGGSAINIFNISKDFAGAIKGGTGNDQFTVNANTSGELLGGDGNDTFVINALISKVSGGNGDDEFIINAATTNDIAGDAGNDRFTVNFANTSRLLGGAGDDRFLIKSAAGNLLGGDGNDVFDIDAIAASIAGEAGDDIFNVNASFANLLSGGDGDDTFNINALVGTVYGGKGSDSFVLGNGSSAATIYGNSNNESDIDFGENNSLTGRNDINVWAINGLNAGKVGLVEFHDVQTLVGNSKKDSFNFDAAGSVFTIKGGSDADNTVTGPGKPIQRWSITGANTGSLSGGVGDGAFFHVTGFENIQNLEGGVGDDEFTFLDITDGATGSVKSRGSITGLVNGGGGSNKIYGHDNVLNTWSISAGITDSVKREDTGTTYATFSSIQQLNGGTGADIFVVTGKGKAVVINGGDDAGDTLQIVNSGAVTTEWDINEDSTGSKVNGLSFFGIRQLQGDDADDEFIFHNGDKVKTVSVNGGGGRNTLNWAAVTSIPELDFSSEANKFSSIAKVIGNASIRFYAGSGENEWTFQSNSLGKVKSGSKTIEFENFGQLKGGSGKDTFYFTDAAIQINADAGAGDGENIVDLQGVKTDLELTIGKTVMGVLNVKEVKASSDSLLTFTLKSSVDTNIWNITDKNTGSLQNNEIGEIKFVNFKNLMGGKGTNTFAFWDNGSIGSASSVAGGINTLDLKEINQDKTINLDGKAILGVEKITAVTGNAEKEFTLKAISGANTWIVDGENKGSFSNSVIGTVTFTNFKHLIGGSGDDEFKINGIIGSIDGGGNNAAEKNTLSDTSNLGKTWSLTNGRNSIVATLGKFDNIQVLKAGSGADTFKIESDFLGPINAGEGDNRFEIGAAAGTLTGGSGKDTFILMDNGSAVLIDGGDKTAGNILERRNSQGKSTWNITAENVGELLGSNNGKYVSFENIQELQGRSGVDVFNINADFLGAIRGGNGDDIFNINATVTELFGEAGSDSFNFSGDKSAPTSTTSTLNAGVVTKIIDGGNGDGDIDTIFGRNTNTRWELLADGTRRISTFKDITDAITPANIYVVEFSAVEAFNGGDAEDYFQNKSSDKGLKFSGGKGVGYFVINNTGSSYVGFDEDDKFIIDLEGSVNGTADSIDGGEGNNTLIAGDLDNTWEINSANKGSLTYTLVSGELFKNEFERIQNLVGGSLKDDFTFKAAIGNVQGNEGDDTFTFTGNGTATNINGGVDKLVNGVIVKQVNTIQRLDSINTWMLDSFTSGNAKVDSAAKSFTTFENIQVIAGKEDTLKGANLDTDWAITAAGKGSLSLADANTPSLQFSGIKNLTGNQSVDKFIFSKDGAIVGVIDGGSAATTAAGSPAVRDVLDVKSRTQGSAINLGGVKVLDHHIAVQNIETIVASTTDVSRNYLYGSSQAASYDWMIDGENKGSVHITGATSDQDKITFENFGHVRGGKNSDSFKLMAAGSIADIDGGDGIDFADYSLSEIVEINLGSDGSTGTSIKGVEGIKGNSDGLSITTQKSIISAANAKSWTIGSYSDATDGINDGQVIIGDETISFENFNFIFGGQGDDTFSFTAKGQIIGEIHGGGGADTFDASASSRVQVVAIAGEAAGQTNLFAVGKIIGNSLNESRLLGAAQNNSWSLVAGEGESKVGKTGSSATISFKGFTQLVGGALSDVFTLENANDFTLLLDGGSATANANFKDVVNITKGDVGVGLTATAGLRITNMDEVNAIQASSASQLIADADDNAGNSWSITDHNKGTLNTRLAFTGFASLTGGAAVDVFHFNGAAAAIDGVIDAGMGDDILNLDSIARDVKVHVVNADKSAVGSHINIFNIEDVTASADHSNTFSASDLANTWVIDAKDTGTLNRSADSAGTKFTHFSHLLGGAGDDTFTFIAAGAVSGSIDGALGEGAINKVNVSQATVADIVLGQYQHIDEFTGNNSSSRLTGYTTANNWILGAEKNSGSVNQIAFLGFANLAGAGGDDVFTLLQGGLTGSILGGSGNNTFKIAASEVTGTIEGGLGNDSFEVAIAAGSAQNNTLVGGDGIDTLRVTGGGADYTAAHIAKAQWGGELTYTAPANEFTLAYSTIDTIYDDLVAGSLTLKDTPNTEEFAFKGNAYSLVLPNAPEFINTAINFSNKTNLVVAASEGDLISISGELNAVQSLRLENASVFSRDAAVIRINELQLNNIGSVGSEAGRLNLSLDSLSVANAKGDIYLKNDRDLVINEFSNNQLFDASLSGDLSNAQAMTSAGHFVIASTANINLTQDNLLSGDINLSGINVALRNVGVTHLQYVNAQNLNINTAGSIDGKGAINVSGNAIFASNDSIVLMNADNHFNALSITSAASASINDKGLLTLSGLNASGDVAIYSSGILINGAVVVAGLQVEAGQSLADIKTDIAAQDSININATGINLNGNLSASDINLKGATGDVKLNGLLDTRNKQAILVSGNNLTQNARILSGGDIVLQASGDLTQGADMESAANILVSADGDLRVDANTTTIGNQVRYLAGRAMALLGNLTARNKADIDVGKIFNQSGSVKVTEGDLAVNAGQYIMEGDASLATTKGSISVKSADDIIVRNINASNDIALQAADLVQIDKALTASLGTIKVVAENDVAVLGALDANSSINLDSLKGSIIQNASISNRSDNITLVANNDIVMNTAGVSTAETGNVNYSGKNIALSLLNARNATVFLTATEGAITDINDPAADRLQLNIDAKTLDAMAVKGIGAGNAIETNVSEILLSNSLGNININNSRAVTIKQMRTNGDVSFNNTQGNVLLGNVAPPASAETPTRPAADAVYQINDLEIKTSGNLLAEGTRNLNSPEIIANNTKLFVGGTIGAASRPLVIKGDTVLASSKRTWKPIFTNRGTGFTDLSKTSASIADITASSHEQLVQVETLAEVNPAIFTEVRNYVYDEVAILLPEDQRYDASDEQ